MSDNHRALNPSKSNKCGVAPRRKLRPRDFDKLGAKNPSMILHPNKKGSKCYL